MKDHQPFPVAHYFVYLVMCVQVVCLQTCWYCSIRLQLDSSRAETCALVCGLRMDIKGTGGEEGKEGGREGGREGREGGRE